MTRGRIGGERKEKKLCKRTDPKLDMEYDEGYDIKKNKI
jgi:hypothetical protein